jgi:ABC-2 type transport system permease protein
MKDSTFITLLKKDLKIFFKNKFFTFITILGLVAYVLLYFIMPKSVDDKISLVIFVNTTFDKAFASLEGEEVKLIKARSVTELKELVIDKKVLAGYEVNIDPRKNSVDIKIYTISSIEPEMKEALVYIAKEMIYTELGYGLNITSKNEILGEDLAGKQIPPSKRIVPVFAFLIILMETLGIANLIADEIERKTIYALLVTKATIRDILIAKGITGLITTLIPSILFIIITIGFSHFIPVFVLLLFGSIFAISIGFLDGSLGRDIMSVLAWGALILIIFLLPAFNIMAPGSLTSWVKIVPTYYFVMPLHRIINFGESILNLIPHILILLLSSIISFLAAWFLLRRRTYES